jgi:hypothetical protein
MHAPRAKRFAPQADERSCVWERLSRAKFIFYGACNPQNFVIYYKQITIFYSTLGGDL